MINNKFKKLFLPILISLETHTHEQSAQSLTHNIHSFPLRLTHTLLPLVPAPGAVSAPQNAPSSWPPQPDVVTPGALQGAREITVG